MSWIFLSLTWITLQSAYVHAQPSGRLEPGLSIYMALNFYVHACTGQQCAYGMPFPQSGRTTYFMGRPFAASILIPGMNFTCDGTITRVTVGGVMRPGRNKLHIKFCIWKENSTEPGIYHKSRKAIVLALNQNMCNEQDRQCMLQLMGEKQISVEPGDILGIELPRHNDADFELHLVSAPGLTNYIFRGTNLLSTVDLSDSIMEIEVQPLIMFGMRSRDSGIIIIIINYEGL